MTYFIVDGDTDADTYGQASDAQAALALAQAVFTDNVSHVELYGPIRLRSGKILEKAFVAITQDCDAF